MRIRELVAVYRGEGVDVSEMFLSSRDVVAFLRKNNVHEAATESFWVVALDARNRPRAFSEIARGSTAQCPVDTATVFRWALLTGADRLMIAHNHPSGECDPSRDDQTLTARLVEAGHILGVQILDHVIVGGRNHYSFLDSGIMPEHS